MPSAKSRTSSFWPRLASLRTRAPERRAGLSLYEAIVAQARSEALYRDYGVPDTVNGRFEMTVLHVALVAARLQAEGEAGEVLARTTMEAFVADMDDACRRLGIGDMGVPKHVKKATAAVMERGKAYHAAMALPQTASEDELAAALAVNVWETPPTDPAGPRALADYVRRVVMTLDRQPGEGLVAGLVSFPSALAP